MMRIRLHHHMQCVRRSRPGLLRILLTACVLIVVGAATTAAAPTLLVNGDFGGAAGWSSMGEGGSAVVDWTVAHGGRSSGKLQRETYGFLAWDQVVAGLKPGASYLLSGWVRASAADGIVSFGVRTPETGDAYPRLYRSLSTPGTWQRVQFQFLAPPEGRVRLILGGKFAGDLWFDDITLEQLDLRAESLAAAWNQRIAGSTKPVYTGLVIDASGMGVERGISPAIYDPEGKMIYGGMAASPERIVKYGTVAYASNVAEGVANQRLQLSPLYPYSLPLIIRPLRPYPERPVTSVVVSEHQAQAIRDAVARYDFLGRFAVVFVVDSYRIPLDF